MEIYHKSMLLFVTFGLWMNVALPLVLASETKTLNIAIDQGMNFQEIRARSEAETNTYIGREFAENPEMESFKLTVLGQKLAEIVPLFSLKITRTQWQSSPHISSWVKYNQTSFALLQPRQNSVGNDEEFVAASTVSNASNQVFSNANTAKRLELTGLNVVEESAEEEEFVSPQFYLGDID